VSEAKRILTKIRFEPAPEHMPEGTSPCWIWTGRIHRDGYGQVKYRGKNHYTHKLVHRLTTRTTPPDGHEYDHLCYVRACCNPAHIEIVSKQENLDRRQYVMSRDDVAAIRASKADNKTLAVQYGVTAEQIRRIKKGERWT
jgi:hypothetical protein